MTGKDSLFLRIGDHVIKGDLKVNKRKRILNLLEDMGDHKRVRFMPISLEAFQSLEDLNELVVNANNCIQMELNEGISPIAF